MSNAQADALRIEMLGGYDERQRYLILKPIAIKPKQLKALKPGVLLGDLDPYHLRIVQGPSLIARAKLGRIGAHEAIHIVSTRPEPFPRPEKTDHHLMEVRLRTMPDAPLNEGEIIECDAPLFHTLLVTVDGVPTAMGELVEYDNEPMVRITRLIG
jgi:hypothetical protein